MDRHLRGVLIFYGDETALKVSLRNAKLCPKVYHRTELMYFLSPV